jgi:hypothetical protein
MTKPKPPAPDDMPLDEEAIFDSPGLTGRENITIYDRDAPWLGDKLDDLQIRHWIVAIEAVDKGDPKPLLEQLRQCVPAEVFLYVEDLLERLARKGKPGRPRTPLYDRSSTDTRLALACEEVKELVRNDCKVEDACKEVAKNPYYPSFETIKNAYEGSRTSTRRLKQRSKPK